MTTIYYIPAYSGSCYVNHAEGNVNFDMRILDTQGLLDKLALHAGIHQEQPSLVERQVGYYQALSEFDNAHPGNIYHRSIAIDGMSVARTLWGWRGYLSLCGWRGGITLEGCERLNTLARIEQYYTDKGISQLLCKVSDAVAKMGCGTLSVPDAYRQLEVILPCDKTMLPDYLHELFDGLERLGVRFSILSTEGVNKGCKVTRMTFTQQWKAEAWLSQQEATAYNVWLNRDNKRLDNWLHMSGNPVSGSKMMQSNPQITQLFLIAIQLFQRPLNVNVLLQYLLLPSCPLDWSLRKILADKILSEGGACNQKVKDCINDYIRGGADEKECRRREEKYLECLPFDLRADDSEHLAEESDTVSVKEVTAFVQALKGYINEALYVLSPDDIRVPQYHATADSFGSLLRLLATLEDADMPTATLQQWAQMLYDAQDYSYYTAQVGCRTIVNSPANILSPVRRLVWCDFYGDSSQALSTDFLSPNEMEKLTASGVKIWNPAHEAEYLHMMQMRPLQLTTDEVLLVSCRYSGTTRLPFHPLSCYVSGIEEVDGDASYSALASKPVSCFDNHREEDNVKIEFDAEAHPLDSRLRTTESFSALESLLQNPFDYFMRYHLQFSDVYDAEFNASITFGNVAHEVIEHLFTGCTDHSRLEQYIKTHYEEEFNRALVAKGAYLLLPENHFDKHRLHYQLYRCVNNLAAVIIENRLKVVDCEQQEEHNLGFPNGISIKGYIDMVLEDAFGRKVVFDLKWTSMKNKHKKLVESNRATQLAIYQAFLEKKSSNVRTAFFTMPQGRLITKDEFSGEHVDQLSVADVDLMEQLRKGYSARLGQLQRGMIETAGGVALSELEYMREEGVFPVDGEGAKGAPTKKANNYSDYKCFTI